LCHEYVVPVFSLSAGGDLDALPQQVKTRGDVRVARWSQMVEGPGADRVLGDEHELVTMPLGDQRRQQPLTLGIQIVLGSVGLPAVVA
jgi:hypothetical protein